MNLFFWLNNPLSPVETHILKTLLDSYSDYFYPHRHFTNEHYTYKDISLGMRSLRNRGLVEYQRGLMDEDGMVAGSGNQIKPSKRMVVERLRGLR
jgi:hypothetical protein